MHSLHAYLHRIVAKIQWFFKSSVEFFQTFVHYNDAIMYYTSSTTKLTQSTLCYTYLFVVLDSFITADRALLVLRYFTPCLYSSCDLKANLRGNSFPQTPQEYCILSACACAFTLWQTRFDIWLKPLPQSSHLYGLSFVCVNTWFRKLPGKTIEC